MGYFFLISMKNKPNLSFIEWDGHFCEVSKQNFERL